MSKQVLIGRDMIGNTYAILLIPDFIYEYYEIKLLPKGPRKLYTPQVLRECLQEAVLRQGVIFSQFKNKQDLRSGFVEESISIDSSQLRKALESFGPTSDSFTLKLLDFLT